MILIWIQIHYLRSRLCKVIDTNHFQYNIKLKYNSI